jgi:uncharacterized phage infection (PIP) family protein YhgE
MASIEEVRAGIAAANDRISESFGPLQQAHAYLSEAQGMLMRATEGSGQADVQEAAGLLAQALGHLTDGQQAAKAAMSSSEGIANRL